MIFVTGGTGLIGSHLLYALAAAGKEVVALKRKNADTAAVKNVFSYYSKQAETLFNTINWKEGDICNPVSLAEAMHGATQVYHAAAMVSFDPADKKQMAEINIAGTANVVNQCLEQNKTRLCYVSSVAALGKPVNGVPVHEDNLWESIAGEKGYAGTKFLAEMEVWRGFTEGLSGIIVNPSVVLGPGFWHKGSSALFGTIAGGLKFYTPGINGYVDVRDVAGMMISLMQSDISGERFILDAGSMPFRELAALISEALGTNPPNIKASPLMGKLAAGADWFRSKATGKKRKITLPLFRAGQNKNYYSNAKISKQLNRNFIPIDQSIKETAALYKKDQNISGKNRS